MMSVVDLLIAQRTSAGLHAKDLKTIMIAIISSLRLTKGVSCKVTIARYLLCSGTCLHKEHQFTG